MPPLAGTLECSTHPDAPSFVVFDQYQGRTLTEVLQEHPEFLETDLQTKRKLKLPILIKFIDAKKDLSVQVQSYR
ncbi:type I phosphomannose isomerase catalytic subunit [Enterococcus faecium]|uniref:type I phosphomannose isomerase catalytic subunit n=1 Tax=Enterococcus faecium TaxID=1352 RepID=UPI0033900F56